MIFNYKIINYFLVLLIKQVKMDGENNSQNQFNKITKIRARVHYLLAIYMAELRKLNYDSSHE